MADHRDGSAYLRFRHFNSGGGDHHLLGNRADIQAEIDFRAAAATHVDGIADLRGKGGCSGTHLVTSWLGDRKLVFSLAVANG